MSTRELTREAYAVIFVSAPWHRKVLSIPDEDRAAAFGFWAASLALCQAQRNDGLIPRPQLAGVFACPEAQRERLVETLVAAGLFDDVGDSIQIHDYSDHNRTRAEIESAHHRMREGGRRGGQASPKTDSSLPFKPTLQPQPSRVVRAEQSRAELCSELKTLIEPIVDVVDGGVLDEQCDPHLPSDEEDRVDEHVDVERCQECRIPLKNGVCDWCKTSLAITPTPDQLQAEIRDAHETARRRSEDEDLQESATNNEGEVLHA